MEQDTIDLLKELVAIDSQNPSLVPGAAGESQIAAYVADWAKGAGLTAEIMEETPGRPSVVVRSGASSGASSARSLLLCGHLDTVGVSEMSDPLTPVVRGNRLYGRGAYDMKGGLAAALIACREAARRGLDVTVAAVADEEHSSLGVQEILRHVRADAAIVTEPTELTVATAHRGNARDRDQRDRGGRPRLAAASRRGRDHEDGAGPDRPRGSERAAARAGAPAAWPRLRARLAHRGAAARSRRSLTSAG
jgi:acetylornithine deacetylase/succinyl-diaminopimelate desuccinylase-like protein